MPANTVFNVNGELDGDGLKDLETAIHLALKNSWKPGKVAGYRICQRMGLVLYSRHEDSVVMFPVDLTSAELTPIVVSWLRSKETRQMKLEGNDREGDHDGDNVYGWRVHNGFLGDWKRCGLGNGAVCAITPCYLWFGK